MYLAAHPPGGAQSGVHRTPAPLPKRRGLGKNGGPLCRLAIFSISLDLDPELIKAQPPSAPGTPPIQRHDDTINSHTKQHHGCSFNRGGHPTPHLKHQLGRDGELNKGLLGHHLARPVLQPLVWEGGLAGVLACSGVPTFTEDSSRPPPPAPTGRASGRPGLSPDTPQISESGWVASQEQEGASR